MIRLNDRVRRVMLVAALLIPPAGLGGCVEEKVTTRWDPVSPDVPRQQEEYKSGPDKRSGWDKFWDGLFGKDKKKQ